MNVNLLLVGGDAVSLAGLMAILELDERICVVKRAAYVSGAPGCISEVQGKDPVLDVVILGEPPTKEAMCESAAQICARYRNGGTPPKILVVSRNDSDDAIIVAVRAGIIGYLSHVQVPEELHNAVQIVGKGGAIFSPTIAVRLSQFFSTGDNHSRSSSFYDLTARELQIVDLLASGMRNGEIARRLYLTEKTVRNYVSRIFVKLDVHDRAGAALRARGAGFGLLTEGGPSMATKAGGGALHRQPPGSRAPGHARESGRSGRATAVRDHGDDAGG